MGRGLENNGGEMELGWTEVRGVCEDHLRQEETGRRSKRAGVSCSDATAAQGRKRTVRRNEYSGNCDDGDYRMWTWPRLRE